jgi:hypothetical protein
VNVFSRALTFSWVLESLALNRGTNDSNIAALFHRAFLASSTSFCCLACSSFLAVSSASFLVLASFSAILSRPALYSFKKANFSFTQLIFI